MTNKRALGGARRFTRFVESRDAFLRQVELAVRDLLDDRLGAIGHYLLTWSGQRHAVTVNIDSIKYHQKK